MKCACWYIDSSACLEYNGVACVLPSGDWEVRVRRDVWIRPRGKSCLVRCDWSSGPQRSAAVGHQAGLHEDQDQTHRDVAKGVSKPVREGERHRLLTPPLSSPNSSSPASLLLTLLSSSYPSSASYTRHSTSPLLTHHHITSLLLTSLHSTVFLLISTYSLSHLLTHLHFFLPLLTPPHSCSPMLTSPHSSFLHFTPSHPSSSDIIPPYLSLLLLIPTQSLSPLLTPLHSFSPLLTQPHSCWPHLTPPHSSSLHFTPSHSSSTLLTSLCQPSLILFLLTVGKEHWSHHSDLRLWRTRAQARLDACHWDLRRGLWPLIVLHSSTEMLSLSLLIIFPPYLLRF